MAISQQIILKETEGTTWTKISSITTIPGIEQELFVFTIPSLTSRVIHYLSVSAIINLWWELWSDSILSHGVTSPSNPESERFFIPPIKVSSGKVVRLKIRSSSNVQSVTCRAELRASDIPE